LYLRASLPCRRAPVIVVVTDVIHPAVIPLWRGAGTIAAVRSVIITGVSRGLGAALFDEVVAAGHRMLAIGRRFTDSQYAAERAEPQRIRLRQAELAYPASLPAAPELSSFVQGAPDVVLVHNAAVLEPVGAIGSLNPDEIAAAVAVNLTAPMILTNAVLGAGARSATVVFISSGAAHRPIGGWSVYGATKRGGESFFDALAAQHADDRRVTVVNVNPGVMDTDMQGRVRDFARQDVYFPDRARFLELHERGELPPARSVAQRILAEHLNIDGPAPRASAGETLPTGR
jgi:benzil reductase ((S)-benzoin forming)